MQKRNEQEVFHTNLTHVTAALALGEEALRKVLGSDEASTQVDGQSQETRDLQELLASRMAKQLGV